MFILPLAPRALPPAVLARAWLRADAAARAPRRPAMDVAENENAFTLTFDLPGLRKEQVSVQVEADRLRIASVDDDTTAPHDGAPRVIWRERSAVRFARELALPEGVDAAAIDAKFVDGVLTVTLPKVAKPAPVRVPIN